MKGRVVSQKLQNTVTVLVDREVTHPLYKKTYARSKKYLVDDQIGVKPGDIVEIGEIRPVSKNKYFRIVKVLGSSMVEIAHAHMKVKAAEIIAEVMPEKEESEQVTVDSEQVEEKVEAPKVKKAKKESK